MASPGRVLIRLGEKKITSEEIIDLIALRHTNDVFVPECKDGPTAGANHFRMDAWAMKKSWSNTLTTGYEVKVSRGDFLRDDKWSTYLNYCNEFYFACPQGVIRPEELPEHVGLMYIASTGSRLFIKKKAVYREVTIPEDVFRYILMCRTRIVKRMHWEEEKTTKEHWRAWLGKKEVDYEFGRMISGTLREVVKKKIEEVKRENTQLKEDMLAYAEVKKICDKMGISTRYLSDVESRIKQNLKSIQSNLPNALKYDLKNAIRTAQSAVEEIEKFEKEIDTEIDSKGSSG